MPSFFLTSGGELFRNGALSGKEVGMCLVNHGKTASVAVLAACGEFVLT